MFREIRNQYREETGKDCKTRQMAGLGFTNDYVQWLESKAENLIRSTSRAGCWPENKKQEKVRKRLNDGSTVFGTKEKSSKN